MELKDYTTIQLLDELKRRFREQNPIERKISKPEYAVLKAKVVRITGTDRAFTHWSFFVKFDEEDVEKFNSVDQAPFSPVGIRVPLYSGKFKKDNPPKIGDVVIVRDRLTKASPKFTLSSSRIMEVVNE